ncbi:GNAT family N-acetyltransferase [Actinomadura hallensis]|uniref:GNAT family N-acetyltransferase n=1 Tax=Actinomadura hallensis TaxID=337895 RepID=UPI001151DF1B|nr:GNAT family N-acetyltransferase [Actinomadura hallensis]HLV73416.1 GNAT family N-acetyltransferase [Vulgatibacteraceae bacterium]
MTSGTFGAPVRSQLQAPLRPAPPPPPGIRPFARDDVPALVPVMWDAYRGTPDEADVGGPEGAAREIRLALGGEYGRFLPGASFVAEDGGRPVGAALVTHYAGLPLLAFLFVRRSHAGRGFGQALVRAVMHVLAEQGHDTLSLAVTRRNRRARQLYDRLGFVEVA